MNGALYAATVLIWGSTWLAIKHQLGVVAPTASIAYRFALAAVLLVVWARVRGLPLAFPLRVHGRFALMGAFMFSTNFVCFYMAENHLTTGLVAIIFALSLPLNMLFAKVFFRRPVTPKVLVGGTTGLAGIIIVFWPELVRFNLNNATGRAIALSLAGTLLFCFGNVVSGKAQALGLPVVQSTAYAMAYGAALMSLCVLVFASGFKFDTSTSYTGSLIYLAVFGSVIGFGAYLTLLGRIGGERAAYATVLFPIVALLLSTMFESFTWTWRDVIGVALILVGNAVVLIDPAMLRRLLKELRPPADRRGAPMG